MSVALGILYHEYRQQGEPFGLETLHFRQLCEMGQVRGMCVFVFTPDGIIREGDQIRGYTPDPGGHWTARAFDLPQVIYPRGVTMDAASEDRMVKEVIRLRARGVQLVNSSELMQAVGDKWLTYQFLSAHPIIKAHLPDTAPLSNEQLVAMLELHPIVMVKHRRGFESRGMIRITALPVGGYSCVINDLDARRQRLTLPSLDALYGMLAQYARPAGDFIIQQGIKLANVQGRSFELRVILNKAQRSWLRTGMVVRLSSNPDLPFLAVGSERNQRPSEIFPAIFGERADAVLTEVRRLARTVVAELESVAGPGGELALDFGFDEQGRPWLIEGNSKPFNLFIRTGAYSLRRKNMARVLEYAQQLAVKQSHEAGVLH